MVNRIVEQLGHNSVALISQDCYYRPLSDLERRDAANFNFDHPTAFDFDKIKATLSALRNGAETISVPTYDFTKHTHFPPEHDTLVVSPAIVIFEGTFAQLSRLRAGPNL